MSTAVFLKTDTTTQGTWYNGSATVYGSDGYAVIGQGAAGIGSYPVTQGYFNYPAYATVTPGTGTSAYCWQPTSNSAPALEYAPPGTSNGTDSNRVQAAWYSDSSFTVDLQDNSSHRIALYFADFGESNLASQTITITDDNNGNAQLDSRTISSFSNGVWLVWLISGKVTFTLTENAIHAVVCGIFFDTPIGTIFPPLITRPRFEPAHYE